MPTGQVLRGRRTAHAGCKWTIRTPDDELCNHRSVLNEATRGAPGQLPVLHAGLAFGAFHHFVYAPVKAGGLHGVGPLAKAGLTALFTVHELKLAKADAESSPTLCHLGAPFETASAAISGATSSISTGKASPQAIESLNNDLNAVGPGSGSHRGQASQVAIAGDLLGFAAEPGRWPLSAAGTGTSDPTSEAPSLANLASHRPGEPSLPRRCSAMFAICGRASSSRSWRVSPANSAASVPAAPSGPALGVASAGSPRGVPVPAKSLAGGQSPKLGVQNVLPAGNTFIQKSFTRERASRASRAYSPGAVLLRDHSSPRTRTVTEAALGRISFPRPSSTLVSGSGFRPAGRLLHMFARLSTTAVLSAAVAAAMVLAGTAPASTTHNQQGATIAMAAMSAPLPVQGPPHPPGPPTPHPAPGGHPGSDNHPDNHPGSDNHPGNHPGPDNHPGNHPGSDNHPGNHPGSDNHPGNHPGSDNHPGNHPGPGFHPGPPAGWHPGPPAGWRPRPGHDRGRAGWHFYQPWGWFPGTISADRCYDNHGHVDWHNYVCFGGRYDGFLIR